MEGRKEKERAWLLKIHDLDQTLLIVLQEKHFFEVMSYASPLGICW